MPRKSYRDLDALISLSRRAPVGKPGSVPPGFAARVARMALANGSDASKSDIFIAIRWAVLTCAILTLFIAAVNARVISISRFAPDTAFESHVSRLVSFGE